MSFTVQETQKKRSSLPIPYLQPRASQYGWTYFGQIGKPLVAGPNKAARIRVDVLCIASHYGWTHFGQIGETLVAGPNKAARIRVDVLCILKRTIL